MQSGAASQQLPVGRIALLLTDVEGSTAAWDRDAAGTDELMQRHDVFVAATVTRHGGVLLKSKGEGDSTFSVFSEPAAAVAAALDLARGFPDAGVSLPVRVAVHVGEVEPRGGDYFGPVPNRAARLRGLAPGGQVLLSSSVVAEVGTRLPEHAEVVALGTHQLRGLAEPEEVFGLAHPDLDPVEPLVVTRAPTNLPAPVDSFVGRDDERTALEKALGEHRLVTIVGPGGVGKTRLALEAAADGAHALPGGTWFVDVGPMLSPDELAPAFMTAIGAALEPGIDAVEAVAASISDRALLVLDTCEAHLDAAAEFVDALLHACDDLAVLATSRQTLRVRGEAVLRLESLGLDDGGDAPSEAAQLFLARADAADVGGVGDLDLAAVEQVCVALDGIPLALELAAARLGELELDELVEQLSEVIGLDESGDARRSGPARQRTVRATVQWSLDSAPAAERAVLSRLTVFRGGWPRGAPEAVCADAEIPADVVSRAHARLVARSLVVAAPDTGAGPRHRLLDAVRTVAAEELDDAGRAALAARHVAWSVVTATALDEAASAGELANWLAHFAAELPNLRTSVARAVEVGDAAAAQTIAAASCNAWTEMGAFSEASQTLDTAIAAGGDGQSRARALAASALVAMFLGDPAKAGAQVEEAIQLVRSDRAVPHLLRSEVLGVAARFALENSRETAHAFAQQALEAARLSGDRHCLSIALNNAAVSLPPFAYGERLQLLSEAAESEAVLGNALFARVNLAVAFGQAGHPARGLRMLDALDDQDFVHGPFGYFYVERARASLELQVRPPEVAEATAHAALARAAGIGLNADETDELLIVAGRALARLGRCAEALSTLDSVTSDEWRESAVLRSIDVLMDLDRVDEAEARLAAVADADDPALLARQTALVSLVRGRPADALATVEGFRERTGRVRLGYADIGLTEVEVEALRALRREADAEAAARRLDALLAEAAADA